MNISIIIPTYKPDTYIEECLRSLFLQTLNHHDFEILIILNGDKEPYFSRIKEFVHNNNNGVETTLIYNSMSGVSNARNVGIEKAKGEYISFVDDDDWLSPTFLETMLNTAIHYNKSVLVCSNVKEVKENGSHANNNYFLTKVYNDLINNSEKIHHIVKARSYMSVIWAHIIHRDIIGSTRYDTNLILSEDSVFMTKLSNIISGIALAPENATYYIRNRENSASRKHFPLVFKIRTVLKLAKEYAKIYISGKEYNLTFVATRIIAVFLKLLHKDWA